MGKVAMAKAKISKMALRSVKAQLATKATAKATAKAKATPKGKAKKYSKLTSHVLKGDKGMTLVEKMKRLASQDTLQCL